MCSTCHAIHDPERIVPVHATVSDGCTAAGCHTSFQPGELAAAFTHSVGKPLGGNGMVTCTGCHDPHGPLNSTRCLDCHVHTPEMVSKQSEKAQEYHAPALSNGKTCIDCHKGIAHKLPQGIGEDHQLEGIDF